MSNLKQIVSRWTDPVQQKPWKEPVTTDDVVIPKKASPTWVNVSVTLPTPEEATQQIAERGFASATLTTIPKAGDKPISMTVTLSNVLLARFPPGRRTARFKAFFDSEHVEIGERIEL